MAVPKKKKSKENKVNFYYKNILKVRGYVLNKKVKHMYLGYFKNFNY